MSKRVPTAVLISGRGSNMASLLEAAADPAFPAKIVAVISNVPDAPGLELARKAGVEAVTIDHRTFGRDRGAHESALHGALVARNVRLVCLAGYMRLLTPFFVGVWQGRLLNIHPSLLPAFPGLHTHARAIQAGVKIHGCTVHWVTEGMDEGPPIAQAAVPVLAGDTPETLAARVLAQEHILYPVALHLAAGGKPPAPPGAAALMNPMATGLPVGGSGS
jgi:formyltetrahydrofolate-dependent phosphoribosylglycinamide formyltransferase